MLPNVEPHMLYLFRKKRIETIPELWKICQRKVEPLASILRPEMDESLIDGVYEALHRLPMLNLDISLAIGDGEPVIIPKREFLTAYSGSTSHFSKVRLISHRYNNYLVFDYF